MPKNILQDVNPPKKRSIRDIPLKNDSKITSEPTKSNPKKNNLADFSGPIEGIRNSKITPSKKKWWIGLIIIFIIILFALSFVFSSATISIIPKQETIDFDAYFTASLDSSGDNSVPFEIFTIEDIGSKTTFNFKEKEVEQKASGEITVFNTYDSSDQRLVKNTRFETSDGLIYRIQKSLVVPGRTVKDGEIIPGSIKAIVYADSPGEEYNRDLTDFTIPGFKGTDRFSKFYAKSNTRMIGGFSGQMKVIDDSEKDSMRVDIRFEKDRELREQLYSQIPEGFVLFDDNIYIDFESQPNIDMGDSVAVVEKIFINAVLFNKRDLSNYIARSVMSDYSSGDVEIGNIEDLNFDIDDSQSFLPIEDSSFEFNLNGLANFVWVFDEDKLKADFAGKTKKNTNNILSNYAGIVEAEASISPFWKIKFPKNLNKIKIENKIISFE